MVVSPITLIDELVQLPSETEHLEFKLNNPTPEVIGECISALANSACLHLQNEAYLIFGIENDPPHEIKGTTFDHRVTKGKGEEDLESWLDGMLVPKVDFRIEEIIHPKGRLVIFYIHPASSGPIKFRGKSWIRIGSYNKCLSEYPDKEAIIWDRRIPFEKKYAKEKVSEQEILDLLDYDKYFELTGISQPEKTDRIIEKLFQENFLDKKRGGMHILNLGAMLLARNLKDFPKLEQKAVRVITYKGMNRLNAIKDDTGTKGYAVGFEGLIKYINDQLPQPEIIEGTLRQIVPIYPPKAIREFVANVLVHQDFSAIGAPPLIEIFDNRIEISNPGRPLIETNRFIDHPPRSRNEILTDTLRRMKICEKRGSGVDRAMHAIEAAQLPPPNIEDTGDGVRVTIYSHKDLSQLTKEEQCRACYYHCSVKYVLTQEAMTNDSLCKRLAIEEKNKAVASRIINDTLEQKLIKPFDPESSSRRYAKYIPFWV